MVAAQTNMLTDGDAAFLRVNNRKPPHALLPGEVYAAENIRFEEGKACPRLGVSLQKWGMPVGTNMASGTWDVATATTTTAAQFLELDIAHQIHLDDVSDFETGDELRIVGGGHIWTYEVVLVFPETSFLTVDWIHAEGDTDIGDGIMPGGSSVFKLTNGVVDSVTHEVTGFTIGTRYLYLPGNSNALLDGAEGDTVLSAAGTFVAEQTSYFLSGAGDGSAITAQIYALAKTCAFARFNDPNGVDNGVLLTDEWRDGDDDDGGRGRAWRICPGNEPQEISLNGHDVWGTARLMQAYHSMLLARHGNERHYFSAAAVDGTDDTIQLNCAPDWNTGDLVFYEPEANSEIVPGPNPHAKYYVAVDPVTNKAKLFGTRADAVAGTSEIDLGTAVGRFYLERSEDDPGPFGNGPCTLMMQPSETETAFERGFDCPPPNVEVTDTSDDMDTITAPSHHFQLGDQITAALSTDTALSGFVYPLSDHKFRLYATQDLALAGSPTATSGAGASGLVDITADTQTGSATLSAASQIALPSLREMIYYKGRIIGVVNGTKDTLVVSDPFDFLHYSLFVGTVKANLGESGFVNWLMELGNDALLIGKDLCVLAITGLSGPDTGWVMDDVTREFGGIAAQAKCNVGSDGWFLSRKGWASVVRSVAGEKLALAQAVSRDIPRDLADVDWAQAGLACCATWNNRFFGALAVKGQETAWMRNNRLLVFNFGNQELAVQQSIVGGQIVGGVADAPAVDSWEGRWTGGMIEPYAFVRLKVAGEERLTYATPDGLVCWFTDGFEDISGPIETELTTRGYFGGARVLTLKGEVNWDTYNPNLTVQAQTAGYNESMGLVEELQFDRTKYMIDGQDDYDPSTSTQDDYDAPHREDYSISPEELLVGRLDVHQNQTENLRMRLRDRSPQLVISNTQGSVRVGSVQLNAMPVGIRGTRQT